MNRISLKKQHGFLTIIAVALIAIVGFVAAALAYIYTNSGNGTIDVLQSTQALLLADSGLEDGTHSILAPTLANRTACSGLSHSNSVPFTGGLYQVNSQGPYAPTTATTLNGALTAAATTIPVASTNGYQSSGRIMIDHEYINYSALNSTNFLNAQRGVDGTTAITHNSGTAVGQYQCLLNSTGAVPSLVIASGGLGGKRVASEVIYLQQGFAVGNSVGGNYFLLGWNKPTEGSWNNESTAGTFDLFDVTVVSGFYAIAVGGPSNVFLYHTVPGTAWTSASSGLPVVRYNSVFCFAQQNCHVVGYMNGGSSTTPTIADYNGTTWTATALVNATTAGDQWAVHCAASNDCWSVGGVSNTAANSRFYHWNGAAWSAVALPATLVVADFPYRGVWCTSTSSCWAVGGSGNFLFWNGTAWSRIVTGMPAVGFTDLYCNNASDCWAVGFTNGANVTIVHYNGTSWTLDTSNPTPAEVLTGVNCTSTNDCWAVGFPTGTQPLMLHWNGSTWVSVTVAGIPNGYLNAVTLTGPSTQPWSTWEEVFS